jgi:hypothetical protein
VHHPLTNPTLHPLELRMMVPAPLERQVRQTNDVLAIYGADSDRQFSGRTAVDRQTMRCTHRPSRCRISADRGTQFGSHDVAVQLVDSRGVSPPVLRW